MCQLRYFHTRTNNLTHTRASPMYTEMNMYSEQEQNSILSITAANAYRNPEMQMCKAHLFNTKHSKEHSKGQNEQNAIGRYQNKRPVNLSGNVRHKQNLRAGFARFHFIVFMFHMAFWVENKHNGTGEATRTTENQDDKEAAQVNWAGLSTNRTNLSPLCQNRQVIFARRFAVSNTPRFQFSALPVDLKHTPGRDDYRPCLLWGVVSIKYPMDSRKKDTVMWY